MRRLPGCARAGRLWTRPLLVSLFAGLTACGCLPFGLGGSRAAVPLKRSKAIILPFSMPHSSYFESQVGARFSREVAQLVRAECPSAAVQDADGVPDAIRQQGIKDLKAGDRIGDASLVQLGDDLGADYVMIGEIHDVKGKDPKSFGVLAGTMVVSARVADVRMGKVVWQMEREKFRYPPLLGGQEEMPAQEKDEEQVVRKVMHVAAIGVSSVFTGRALPRTTHLDGEIR